MSHQPGWEQHTGHFRQQLVWVGRDGSGPRGASHVAYFSALTSYRQGDAWPIVQLFADASRFAASSGRRLIDDLCGQLDLDRGRMGDLRPQAAAWRVLPILTAHPVLNLALLMTELGMTATTAQRALSQLTEAGVLHERTGKRRNRVWQHNDILRILDEYAARLRRQ